MCVRSDLPSNDLTVQLGQAQVQENEIRFLLIEVAERGNAVANLSHNEALESEDE